MRRLLLLLTIGVITTLALAGIGVLRPTPAAGTIVPPGTDVLNVSGQVSMTSLLGSETILLSGTVTIERSSAQIQGGAYVIDAEIIAMQLTGTSITGPIKVVESTPLVSLGEIRSLQPTPNKFPASSFFDVFIVVRLPASPEATVTRRNEVPLHLVPMSGGSEVSLGEWPPQGVKYQATPDPCVPLVPLLPQNICVTDISIAITGVGGIAELAEIAGAQLESPDSSGPSTTVLAGMVAVVAAGTIALGGAAWYAKRRRWAR